MSARRLLQLQDAKNIPIIDKRTERGWREADVVLMFFSNPIQVAFRDAG